MQNPHNSPLFGLPGQRDKCPPSRTFLLEKRKLAMYSNLLLRYCIPFPTGDELYFPEMLHMRHIDSVCVLMSR